MRNLRKLDGSGTIDMETENYQIEYHNGKYWICYEDGSLAYLKGVKKPKKVLKILKWMIDNDN